MERRLNSRSFGLLEVIKKEWRDIPTRRVIKTGAVKTGAVFNGCYGNDIDPLLAHNAVVQVIHQTVKEFVLSGRGLIAIQEDGSESIPEVNGCVLILQFLLSELHNFGQSRSEIQAQVRLFWRIIQYARAVEQNENLLAADKIESALAELPLETREDALERCINEQDSFPRIVASAGKKFEGQIQLLLFYILSELPNSARDLANRIAREINEEEAIHVLATASVVQQSNLMKRKRHPCLMKDILLDSNLGEALLPVRRYADKLSKDVFEASSFPKSEGT